MGAWKSWSCHWQPCSQYGSWNWMIFRLPSNSNLSVILWFYDIHTKNSGGNASSEGDMTDFDSLPSLDMILPKTNTSLDFTAMWTTLIYMAQAGIMLWEVFRLYFEAGSNSHTKLPLKINTCRHYGPSNLKSCLPYQLNERILKNGLKAKISFNGCERHSRRSGKTCSVVSGQQDYSQMSEKQLVTGGTHERWL